VASTNTVINQVNAPAIASALMSLPGLDPGLPLASRVRATLAGNDTMSFGYDGDCERVDVAGFPSLAPRCRAALAGNDNGG